MSIKMLVIVSIVLKRYHSTYCLIQGSCFVCSNFYHVDSIPQNQNLNL